MMRNLRIDLCYDGTRYKGWQRLQQNDNTIQGKLESVLSRLLQEDIEISGSGRTDAGTHARGQVANFHCNSTMTCDDILEGLRTYLPEDIGVYSCKDVSERFHARLHAKEKTYCYRVIINKGCFLIHLRPLIAHRIICRRKVFSLHPLLFRRPWQKAFQHTCR